jgi:Fe-Mn family superoxide dismutase
MFKLPEIDFTKVKFLSEETVLYHYHKHHQAYVDKLNQLVDSKVEHDLLKMIEQSKLDHNKALYNNAAQSWNHTFYWLSLAPAPSALLASANQPIASLIRKQFKTENDLKTKFSEACLSLFGSGWVWLAYHFENENIEIISTSNAEMIDTKKYMPLLVCDVWEHAYYIEFRNSRKNYIDEFWEAVNWNFANENYISKNLDQVSRMLQA